MYPDNFRITVNPDVMVLAESCGIRLSIGTNYAFVTKQFYDYLAKNVWVTFGQLKARIDLNENEVAMAIGSLLKKKY